MRDLTGTSPRNRLRKKAKQLIDPSFSVSDGGKGENECREGTGGTAAPVFLGTGQVGGGGGKRKEENIKGVVAVSLR